MPLRSADRLGLWCGRGRNDGRLPAAHAVDGAVVQAVWAAVWAVAGYVAIWTGLLIYHLWRYRSSGFRDRDWLARHDDSDPGGPLSLELGRRSVGSPHPGVDLELCVKSHRNWEVVDDDELVLMPDNVIRCRFDLNHEVFPSGFYDVRWFRADRGKLVEITRERFQLRNHSVGRRERIGIADQSKIGSQGAARQRGRDQATQSGRDHLGDGRCAPRGAEPGQLLDAVAQHLARPPGAVHVVAA